jgi:RHS repeat-associated protein
VRNLPKTLTRTNGVVTTFSFDALGQLLSLVHSNGATTLNTTKYTYDAAGQRSVVANDISQPLMTQSATGSVDAANELNPFGATTYTYDKNGNRLTESGPNGTLTYAWDGRNRLSSITDASGNKTAMQYDFARNLLGLSQTTGATTAQQSFVVDSLTNVVSLSASSGGVFSLLTGLGIDSHFASVDGGGNVQYGITDALGSITGVTDATGKLASQFKYEPYGQMTGTIAAGYPFGFTGRGPALQGVNYFRNRYYDPVVARFVSEDPIGLLGGFNAFEYGLNSPTGYTDPSGLDKQFGVSGSFAAIGDRWGFSGSLSFGINLGSGGVAYPFLQLQLAGAIGEGKAAGAFVGAGVGPFGGTGPPPKLSLECNGYAEFDAGLGEWGVSASAPTNASGKANLREITIAPGIKHVGIGQSYGLGIFNGKSLTLQIPIPWPMIIPLLF